LAKKGCVVRKEGTKSVREKVIKGLKNKDNMEAGVGRVYSSKGGRLNARRKKNQELGRERQH